MNKPHLLTPEQELELLGLYPTTDTQILSKHYGVSLNFIMKLACKNNVHKAVNNKHRSNYSVPPCVVGGTGIKLKESKFDEAIAAIEAQMLLVHSFSSAFDELVTKRNNLLARSFSFAQ